MPTLSQVCSQKTFPIALVLRLSTYLHVFAMGMSAFCSILPLPVLVCKTRYYEKNGVKSKAQKILQKQNDGTVLITKRIHRKNAIDETSEIKIKEAVKESERVLKNGRIRRGENTPEISTPYTSKTASTLNTTLDALGNKFKTKSESNAYYLSESAEHQSGKVRVKTNKDGSITLYEYHPKFEGNFRTYTTQKGFELKDVSGDGVIGLEDLQNTPVIVEDKESIDWQGSRHSKRLINKKAKASFGATDVNGYNVVLSDEEVLSQKEYEHKRTDNGGLIEEITTYTAKSDGELKVSSVSAFEFDTLAMTEPVSQYSLSNLSSDQVGKTIYVSDAGSLGFSANGFLSGTVPNYTNAPRFDSTANTYYSNFRLTGIESETSSTISLPWGGTYTANGFALVSGKSTLEVELTLDYSGKTLYEATYVYIDGAFYLGEWTYYNYDMSTYDLRGTYKHNNTYSTQTALDLNNIRTFTDFNGSEYQIGYADSTESVEIFRRDIGASSTEYGTFTDKITVYAKDVSESGSCGCGEATGELGKKAVSVFSSPQIGGSGTANPNTDELVYQTYEYALNKNVKTLEVDKYGVATRREYIENNDNTYTVKTITSGFTSDNPYSTEIFDADTNELISKTGLGVVSEVHDRTGDKDANWEETICYGGEDGTRSVYKEYFADNLIWEYGLDKTIYNEYDSEGRIIYTESNVDIEYSYDAFGNRIEETTTYIDNSNTDVSISTSGITITYEYTDGVLWKVITSNSSGDILTQKERLSGFANLTYENNPITEEQVVLHKGKRSVSKTVLNRTSKLETSLTQNFASETSTQAESQSLSKTFNGSFVETESFECPNGLQSQYLKTAYAYDNAGRETSVKLYNANDVLQAEYKYFYTPSETVSFADEIGESKTIKSLGYPSGMTLLNGNLKQGYKYVYIPRNEKNAGLIKETVFGKTFNADSSVNSGAYIKIAYNDMGNPTHYWGNGGIPAMYGYNKFGEITDMYLFKVSPNNAGDFTGESWNSAYTSSHASAEHTQWIYNDYGDVVEKIDALGRSYYADNDRLGMTYSFLDPKNNLILYTLSRSGIICSKEIGSETTNYSYDDKIRVSQVSTTYGNYSYSYANDYTMPSIEVLPDGFRLERSFDANGNVSQVVLKDAGANVVYQTNYAYANGRLSSLLANGKTISYSYNNLGSVSEITLNNTAKIVNSYDDLQRLVSQAYKVGTNEVKKSLYTITSDNKITRIEKQRNGIAENNWQYEYFTNMPGLKNATLNAGSGNTQYDAYSREDFEYDLAGNPYRYKSGTTNWNTVSSNKNNQTTQINYASDAVLPIRGKASTSATLNISVDGALQNYTRPSGQENFAFGLNAYTSTRKYQEVKAEAVETDNNTTPPTTIRTMQRGKAYVEATPESFIYDANGNLLSDGRWNYTWDAENRLVEVETNLSAASASVPQEKHVYVYDWTGRKIKSERYEYKDNAWVLVSTNKRYYDDYNLIYEATEYADGSSSDVRKYYYGSDLLGSVYGSAGTGGLRMMSINAEDLFVFNDQVGSVEALYGADAATAAQARAEYVYSAYGEVMMKSGDLADKNNIGYSTRYREGNTGLVGYTYRHYSPRLKKWLSKDPIAEQGGINLYQMVANMPISSWDKLGFSCPKGNMKNIKSKVYVEMATGQYITVQPPIQYLLDGLKDIIISKGEETIMEYLLGKADSVWTNVKNKFSLLSIIGPFTFSHASVIEFVSGEAKAKCCKCEGSEKEPQWVNISSGKKKVKMKGLVSFYNPNSFDRNFKNELRRLANKIANSLKEKCK